MSDRIKNILSFIIITLLVALVWIGLMFVISVVGVTLMAMSTYLLGSPWTAFILISLFAVMVFASDIWKFESPWPFNN